MGFFGGPPIDPLDQDPFGNVGFGLTGQDIIDFVLNLFQAIEQVVVQLGQIIFAVLKAIGDFFVHLWQGFFKSIFQNVLKALRTAHDWLEKRLRPLITFLKKIRALQDAYFKHYLKPLLDMLQHVRQFLQLLRLANIGFAAQLDNYIAGLEARLAQTFATLRAAVNNAIDIVNLLADPTLLLRKPVLLLSIRRQIPALIHAVTGRPPGYWFPSPRGNAGGAFAPVGANFVPSDPNQNPPTSSYLGFEDGLAGVNLDPTLDIGYKIAVDHAEPLDYFNDALYPAPLCTDPAQCLNAALQLLVPKPSHG